MAEPSRRQPLRQGQPALAAARRWAAPMWGLLLRGACLAGSLGLAVRHPVTVPLAAGVAVWVLWPAFAVVRARPAGGPLPGPGLRVRYISGHPALRSPGRGWLRTWPADGAAVLRVGRDVVAFPLAAVQSVALTDGRVHLHTGSRGPVASVVGRLMAHGLGRYCGLRRQGREDLALVDRSRVVCQLAREGGQCRVILTGPAGGGEEIYLEVLVLLRRAVSARGTGTAGGPRPYGAAGGA